MNTLFTIHNDRLRKSKAFNYKFLFISLFFTMLFLSLASQNAIVDENELTGNPASEWDISGAGDLSIQGFATDISVDQGETIYFKIDTDADAYTIDIYRIGYYGGNGACLKGTGVITASLPQGQLTPDYDPVTGTTDCGNWNISAHWDVPVNAVSGIYIAKLTRTNPVGSSHIVFIVRDDDGDSDILFKTSDATWQAYNAYGGHSLYVGGAAGPPELNHASKVSYNRPFITRNGGGGGGAQEDWLFNAEYPMIRWLERNGYDVSYTTDLDMDRSPSPVTTSQHKILLSVGHDEYWSANERAKFEGSRDNGVHLAFFSGNEVYWKTRWEDNHRTLVCYKEGTLGENVCGGNCDPTDTWTGLWRDGCDTETEATDACNPENSLTGQISWVDNTSAITVPFEYKDYRIWRSISAISSLTAGQSATLGSETLGYEWDGESPAYAANYPNGRILMSETNAAGRTHKLSLYKHSSGALVFGAGTCQWSWGLDANHDRGNNNAEDIKMQQATLNLFADMGVQPETLQSGLVAATASTDVTSPVSLITFPTHGSNTPANNPITITGTASDIGGVLAGVDVSVDGGLTWKPATGSTNWTFSWTPLTEGSVTILTRAFDDSGNIEASGTAPAGNAIEVTISAPVAPICPCSIWDPATVPTNITEPDPNPYELGVKFQSNENGYITGVRFYKSTSNTGTHIGNLWTASGTNLASATFINETSSGWQEVTFGSPVQIIAGTTYVASYHTSAGYYSEDDNYFTTDFDSYYLKALADGLDGPNGVYASSTGSTFPTNGYLSSNYYVDVVFDTDIGPDVTPPVVVSASPTNGASGIAISTQPIAYFNEALEATTVNVSTVLMIGPGAAPVTGTANYSAGTITFTPDSPLEYSTTYTLTLKGGYAPRIEDLASNGLSSDYVWSFTTSAPPPPPPTDGPGGPILVISAASNPFSRYPVEILRAQGFNEFFAMDVSEVTSTVLNDYEVIILGEFPLQASMVTDLTSWVNAGGILIALRPDSQLSGLLGITSVGGTLSDKYLLVNTSSGPGVGIVDETIQFHSEADYYTLNGATSLATLYSDATTATSYPAATENIVGANGGKAYAFTYDLARSIVYTRQGNPAWADQKRDGEIDPIRSDDLFFGNASFDPQPDWIDLNKVAIPQADEQQHLLSNIITLGNMHKKPLPRFWFLPKGLKAAIVMTGDDHGDAGMQPRFDIDIAASPVGCSVADWECVRSTGYLYVGSTFTDALAQYYNNLGFEVALHVNTGCAAYTDAQFDNFIDAQFAVFNSTFPSIPLPQTNRNHCIAWSGYAMPAEVQANNGIRLDVNYYYWPNNWTQNLPGMFTGSGQPMRFAKTDGTIIDCYQVVTQMQDEAQFPNPTPYPAFCNALLDKALGSEGYYGVFATNMHFDTQNHAGANAIVASAQSRGIPVVSSKQMLDWLDGRNGSSYENISWNTDELSFTVNVGAGALNLRGMIPVVSDVGNLIGLTQDATPISYTTETIKGIDYAFFPATDGDYLASYGTDDINPVITNLTASPLPDGTVTITWTTNELADSRVDYGISSGDLDLNNSQGALVTNHSITLSGLTFNTTYYFQVTSEDGFANSTTEPGSPASFITTDGNCAEDITDTDFDLGTTDANTLVVLEDGGGVILKTVLNEEFSGTTVPVGWTSGDFNPGGTTVAGGQVTVNGTHVYSNSSFVAGSSIEFVATFNSGVFQNVGFSNDQAFATGPWITIGQGSSADANLYARASDNSNIDLGSGLQGSPHKYRLQWNATNFEIYIDDSPTPSATINLEVITNLFVQISDVQSSDGTLSVDWLRVLPYSTSGSFSSRVFDRGSQSGWGEISWNSTEPLGTSLTVFVRTGNTATPDGSWSSFTSVTNGESIGGSSQYIQYRADLATNDITVTPTLEDLTITCEPAPDLTPPVISSLLATLGQDGVSATITWTTDENANSLVDYGTDENTLSQNVSDASYVLSHSIELTGLTAETTYYYRVTSEDASANSVTEPIPTNTNNFTTLPEPCFVDNTYADFAAGTETASYITNNEDGEVILQPTAAAEFTVLPPTSEWMSYDWGSGGTSTVSGGILSVEGARYNSEPETPGFSQGSVLEFVATFGGSVNQHIGFGGGTNATGNGGIYWGQAPWAMFSTWNTGTAVYARTYDGTTFYEYNFGGAGLIGSTHLYRIEWNANSIDFYVDDNPVHSEPVTINGPMRPAISDYIIDGVVLQVDWIHTTPFITPGTFESRIYNAGTPRLWGVASWTADIPANTTLALSHRQSNSDIDILSVPWTDISTNGSTIGGVSQYIQYKAEFETQDTKFTPVLKDISIACSTPGNIAPVITLNPVSQTVCEGDSAIFVSMATGYPLPTLQWQESPDGTNWTNITDATNDTLAFETEAADNGTHFQTVWSNTAGTATSTDAILSVNLLPTATVVAVNPTICEGEDLQLQLTAATGLAPFNVEINGNTYTDISVNDIFAEFQTAEYSIWQSTEIPQQPAVTDNQPIEIGVKFRSSVPGYINGIRFYKGALNTGIHIGSLWSGSGTNLASATFTDETASGWQEVFLSTPVYIAAGITYIASYYSAGGYFAITGGGLANAVTNGHLTALASGTDGSNGVYLYGEGGGFPSTGNDANYYVDVVFEEEITLPLTLNSITDANNCSNTAESIINVTINPQPTGTISGPVSECPDSPIFLTYTEIDGTGPYDLVINGTNHNGIISGTPFNTGLAATPGFGSGPLTIWPESAVGGSQVVDEAPTELGIIFSSTEAGVISGIRFYKTETDVLTFTGSLWEIGNTSTPLATANYTTDNTIGWKQINFSAPVPIEANTNYMASYFSPNPNNYAFTGDGMSAPVVNAPLTAISSWYEQPGPGYPTTSSSANYWVDVVFSYGNDYEFSLTSISDVNGCSTNEYTGNTINVSVAKCGEFQAFLQGTYDSTTNNMNTGLVGNIPLSQPYNVTPWFYDGTESLSVIDPSVVDWVLVELRSDTETAFERKAALLLEDGSIVQYNNITQGVHFENTTDGEAYYVVVHHRNHMPVMSANALLLNDTPVPYSFTDLGNCYNGGAILLETIPPEYGMIAGDINSNGWLSYSGPGNDRGLIIQQIVTLGGSTINSVITGGYWFEDINLNNEIKYIGAADDRAIILTNLNKLTGSEFINAAYQSVVPSVSTKAGNLNNGPIHIFLDETENELLVKITSEEDIYKGVVDNVQFTFSWKVTSNELVLPMLSKIRSDFGLQPQGAAKEYDGNMYLTYVSIIPVELPDPFLADDEVSLLSFTKDQTIDRGNNLNIADNTYTNNNNAMYYISIWGKDHTGIIHSNTLGKIEHQEAGLAIYPNPVSSGFVHLEMNLPKAQEITISLMDIHGKLVSNEKIPVNAGLSNNQIDLKHIPRGIYFIKVHSDNLNVIQKLIIH